MRQIDVGFDVDKAIVGAVQAAEGLNREFGDWVDVSAVAHSVRSFIKETDPSFKCRNCGWRQKNGSCPANDNKFVPEDATCDAFLHVHEYVDPSVVGK